MYNNEDDMWKNFIDDGIFVKHVPNENDIYFPVTVEFIQQTAEDGFGTKIGTIESFTSKMLKISSAIFFGIGVIISLYGLFKHSDTIALKVFTLFFAISSILLTVFCLFGLDKYFDFYENGIIYGSKLAKKKLHYSTLTKMFPTNPINMQSGSLGILSPANPKYNYCAVGKNGKKYALLIQDSKEGKMVASFLCLDKNSYIRKYTLHTPEYDLVAPESNGGNFSDIFNNIFGGDIK